MYEDIPPVIIDIQQPKPIQDIDFVQSAATASGIIAIALSSLFAGVTIMKIILAM